jgi:hypothetical protein
VAAVHVKPKKRLKGVASGILQKAFRLSAGINVPILRRIWIRFQGASMGAYSLYVPMDATGENGFKDKQDGYIYSCR